MHKKAKLTYPAKKGIPGVMTAQGFHKGKLDFLEVSVIHCIDGIVINASSREVFHRKRLAIPLASTSLASNSSILNSSSTPNSSTKEEKNKKAEQDEKKDEKVEILIRDAFGTFKGEVPYYSARALFLKEETAPALKELDEKYEEWMEGEE